MPCALAAPYSRPRRLAEQAKILMDEAEENNLGDDAFDARFRRWDTCSLCEQKYHTVVSCALGWAAWKTYAGRPEADWARGAAMDVLGNGLSTAKRCEEALSVRETLLATRRRIIDASANSILVAQSNLANSYESLGRHKSALHMKGDVYSGRLRLHGEEDGRTLASGNNYAFSLLGRERFEEAKSLWRKIMPVSRRVFGESNDLTLRMRFGYAIALYKDAGATLDDLHEAVTALEHTARTAQRVFGGAHPLTGGIEESLREARAALIAREAEATEAAAQNAFRTARVKLAQERSELA